jgi:Flp pilus assembly protein TadD
MRNIFLLCIALCVITLAVYMQVGNHQFLGFDDNDYVTSNPHVTSGISYKNIVWAFTSIEAANWHPITWLSHMADVQIYGVNPRGHHITNVIIHSVSSVLLLLLLLRITGSLWQSSWVAALFALHPLHVESVAWVAERKDVISAFFWFLTLLMYSEYVAKRKPGLYILALFSFMLGLMSKPMLVTLPIIMLLMDYWPLGRYRDEEQEQGLRQLFHRSLPLVREKLPFFACSLFSGIVTIYAQHMGGATRSLEVVPFLLRIENSLVAYVTYIIKTLWPHDLAVLYPFPSTLPLWQVIGSLCVLILVTVSTIRYRRRNPYLAVGWFWFLITLVPVIGLIQVGNQAMADRYMHIPVIGLFIMAAWGVPDLTTGLQHRKAILAVIAGATIVVSGVLTWHQLGYWRDSISLFRHTLHVTTGNYLIHNNLGTALFEKGVLNAAIQEYQMALQTNPNYTKAHYNLGVVLAEKGDLDAAIREYQIVLRISPNDMEAHNNLGAAFTGKGNLDAAIQEYQVALRISPNNKDTHNNLGVAFVSKGDLDSAINEFRNVLRLNPNDIDAHSNMGVALAKKGDLNAAIQEFQTVLRITPNDTYAHDNLGRALAEMKTMGDVRKSR